MNIVAVPPVDAVMPPAQVGLLAVWSLFAALTVIQCIVVSRRTRSWLAINLLVGSGLAMFGESLVIANMHTWYPAVDQITAYEAYGHAIPMFAAVAYLFYFAPGILWLIGEFDKGLQPRRLWIYWAFMLLGVAGYEVAGLTFDLWSYYGDQPFMISKLPISWVFLNSLIAFVMAVALFYLRPHLNGWRMLLVIPFMATAVPTVEILAGYPLFVALSADVSMLVRQAAAVCTIGMCVIVVWICSKLACLPVSDRFRKKV
jgi:hypothetical protein